MTWDKSIEQLRREENEIPSNYNKELYLKWLHLSIPDRTKLVKIAKRLFPEKGEKHADKRIDTKNI